MLALRMILKEYRDACVLRLECAGVFNPEADTERIVDAAFDGQPPPLGTSLSATQLAKLEAIMCRRERREPLPRILGKTTFYDLPIKIEPGVFRPYPETEALIEPATSYFQERHPERILDLGTGTGCLLLALLHIFPDATGVGIDNDPRAVKLAQVNADALGMGQRTAFRIGDWSSDLTETFDLIVSNPPRVPTRKISSLLPEMREHDPVRAYDGGADGLDYFRKLAEDFGRIATPGGFGAFQVSDASAVKGLFEEAGHPGAQVELNYLGIPCAVSVVRR